MSNLINSFSPLVESKFIKIKEDTIKGNFSTFEISNEVEKGFLPIKGNFVENKKENIPSFEPKNGFTKLLLDKSQNILSLKIEEDYENLYLKIKSIGEISLEPIFIEVKKGIKARLFIDFHGGKEEMSLNFLNIVLKENSFLELYPIFNSNKRKKLIEITSTLKDFSQLSLFPAFIGGETNYYSSYTKIQGIKVKYIEKPIILLNNSATAEIFTHVEEENEEPYVDCSLRGTIRNSSRLFSKGMLKIKREAKKGSSRYEAHILNLSKENKIEIEPQLEIEALDVKASHSASILPLDLEKLFYLESRGLDRDSAIKELALGFLVVEAIEIELIKNKIEEML